MVLDEKIKKGDYNSSKIYRMKKWWDRRSNSDKAVIGVTAFCLGALIFIIITGLLVPNVTPLSLEKDNVQIGDKATTCIVKGTTQPNASVYISNTDLNINRTPVNVDSNGNFEYKLTIPVELTETSVTVYAKAYHKYEVSQKIIVQRPITPLMVNPIPKMEYDTEDVVVEGQTDPNTSINLFSNISTKSSADLQSYIDTLLIDPIIENITISSDEHGNFKHTFNVPLDARSAYFSVTAKSTGKRNSTQDQNITRDFASDLDTTLIFNNEDKMKHYSGKGFYLDYPINWLKRPALEAGKDCRLYLILGRDVEAIVWYGKMDKNFEGSLENYTRTNNIYTETWWGGTQFLEEHINQKGTKGIRTVYKCEKNAVFSNDIQPPFYIDRTVLTKDNVNVFELYLMVSGNYYERENDLIEKTIKSFIIK